MKKPHIVLGLDILADNEGRFYPYERLLTPIVGYVQIKEVAWVIRAPVAKQGAGRRGMTTISRRVEMG